MCVYWISTQYLSAIVDSHDEVGTISLDIAQATGLISYNRVFAGGADNACGAIGSGILEEGKTLCSIGTSGVVLSYEATPDKNFNGKVHYFNHGVLRCFLHNGCHAFSGL